ncbi:MAG: iron chelate uptake ABC transporter family permease subunit [Propionicimonas sp.]|uniref:FecCD family ABC transporter permease n=1 Tax=Propionicimonas sp. TaxID=1955623 RepID=UPI003D0E7BD9
MSTATTGRVRARHRRLTAGPWTLLLERRSVRVGLVLLGVIVVLTVAGLLIGDYPLDAAGAVRALLGLGDDPLARYFVQQQRAPRVVAALVVGAALAASGSIFTSLSANPLGSPDVIGFTTGSATGALVQIVLFDAGPGGIAAGALLGGFATAAVVYALSWRHGLSGSRLVLVGIGTSAVLQGVNNLLIVRASLTAAQTASLWLAGSFNGTSWARSGPLLALLLLLLPPALALSRPLGTMVLGDELAAGLGVRVERTRGALVAVGIALVAIATATAGPIAFVALAAPQVARRLTRTSGIGMGTAAITGAAMVLASDLVAQRLFAPTQLAVGVVTGSLGGLYLIWLLATHARRAAG